MKKSSLGNKITKYLFDNKDSWIPKGELQRREWRNDNGTLYISDTVGRALRSEEEKSHIAVKYEGKNTLYKWLPYERRDTYIPTSRRPDPKVLFVKPSPFRGLYE